MTPEDRARLEAIEVELAAHDRTGSICLHMQACCSIGTGEHTEWLIAALRRADTDARLAASESTYLLQRAEQAEMERNAARESGAEYIKRTDPLLACDSEDFTCGECRACAIQQRNEAQARLESAPKLWGCPNCAFEFNAQHEDVEGGYSCPLCQLVAAVCVLRALQVERNEWPATDERDAVACLEASEVIFDSAAIAAFAKIAHLVKS